MERRTPAALPPEEERRLAADLFNEVWALLERTGRTVEDDDRMVHAAHASRHHWGRVGGPQQVAIGEWQCARVYSVLGRAEPALHHARRCVEIATASEVEDWVVASAYEGLTRAHLTAGDAAAARAERERAVAACERVADPEDREVVASDLAGLPL